MTIHQLHLQAQTEWRGSPHLRRQYPTFVFYWHEQYERVYQISHTKTVLLKFLTLEKSL